MMGSFYLADDDMDDCMEIVLRSLENDNIGGGGGGGSSFTGLAEPPPPTAEAGVRQHRSRRSTGRSNSREVMTTNKMRTTIPAAITLKIGGSPDEDNLSSKIRYLEKKQVVMTKASTFLTREATYNAAIALQMVAAALIPPAPDEEDTIWDEAKEYLKEDSKGDTNTTMQPPERREPRGGGPMTKPTASPVHPSILKVLNKTVARIAAGDFQKMGMGSLKRPMVQCHHLPLHAMKVEGSWVSDCLRSWTNASARNVDSAWKMSQDARTHAMSLIPPRGTVLPPITTIQAALSCLDTEARLVVQAAPPFRVVHANRSFRLLVTAAAARATANAEECTGGRTGKEHELLVTVVGRPLERLVEVTTPFRSASTQQNHQQQAMDGFITLQGQIRKSCQVRLCPVVEQQHNHHNHHTFERPISHFVVSFSDAVVPETSADLSSSSDSDANESYGSSSSSGPVIGTVG